MADWLSPIGVLAVLATLGLMWALVKWLSKVDHAAREHPGFVKAIKADISEIKVQIANIFGLLNSPITQASPMVLSDFGRQLAEQLNASEWARETAPKVLDSVQAMQPAQVHAFCKQHTKDMTVDSDLNVFSRAYEHGITDEHMRIVLAIVLRDELLKSLGMEHVS